MYEDISEKLQGLADRIHQRNQDLFASVTWKAFFSGAGLLGSITGAWMVDLPEARELNDDLIGIVSCLQEVADGDMSDQAIARVETARRRYLEAFERRFLEQFDTADAKHDEILAILKQVAPPPPIASTNLFLLSGPSSAGKDAIASSVLRMLIARGFPAEYWDKYTTRDTRGTSEGQVDFESRYHKHVTEARFSLLVKTGEIILEYGKYFNRYGFSRSHMERCMSSNTPMLCINSDFQNVEQHIMELRNWGLRVTAMLIDAPAENCERRIWFRNLPDPLVRIDELRRDCAFVEHHEDNMNRIYDVRFRNDDGISFNESSNEVVRFVVDCLLTDSLQVSQK